MKPLIVANWKMNTRLSEALILASGVKEGLSGYAGCQAVLCPPFPWLAPVAEILQKHPLKQLALGAQNIYWQSEGAYTGEVSAEMLRGLVSCVIIGHSERRHYFGETNQEINKKVLLALQSKLRPIICVGEQRRPSAAILRDPTEITMEMIKQPLDELSAAIKGLTPEQLSKVAIAYEPVWAISSNKNAVPATGHYAQAVAVKLRARLSRHLGEPASNIPILYGGSVNPQNVAEFLVQPDINGALVGGASLQVRSFLSICKQST
jgi:triosephosphate isomerase